MALRADMDALPVEEKTGLPLHQRTTYLGNDVGVMLVDMMLIAI